MLSSHLILTLAWVVFCLLHSMFASVWFKRKAEGYLGKRREWFRPLYIAFAFISFGAVCWYQASTDSKLLYPAFVATKITGGIIAGLGLAIMIICIGKYFKQLSGISSLVYGHQTNTLMTTGLHGRVRHPLYLGTFVFIWGIFIAWPLASWLISSTIITIYTLIGIRFEEQKLKLEYGEAYAEYAGRVPRILPF